MNDSLISRQAAIDAVEHITSSMSVCVNSDECHGMKRMQRQAVIELTNLPSAQPTLYGYNIEHLELIARVLQKEDLPPERTVEALTDIGRIVAIVKDEVEEALRKAVEQCMDLISRAEAVEKAKECFDMGDCYCDKPAIIGMLNSLAPAQPELIEKAAYIRGFEQGRTQGMIDTKAEEVAQTNLQPTCNNLATDAISRKAAIDALGKVSDELYENIKKGATFPQRQWFDGMAQAQSILENLPSVQPETNCSEFPKTSDFVSRKAVRDMVATWSYDMAEWEDVELALHDVDELPTAQPEVIRCKDCKHYRTIGAFGVPLHKEEYYCDEEQRELPEWWFCAGARRKENE